MLDEFLTQVNGQDNGGEFYDGVSIAAIAFADDLVLIEDSATKMAISINGAMNFIASREMKLNVGKCSL